ncbi:hypothetical protein ND856_18640 [Leptospira bandrabouensis]|uniref:hypothetical protein n=1 Tax=Leptospira bandrabouensis TaxID=2484903 RepID=UPI00223D5516|nr:hypothetical protein [Leptospira bandrabouensis]MCW7460158.1 hypothetical protein [Leptospira bandrabouensis]MCW7479325.1 hypothetical protein [Leptospira bandrabouensis]MCW7487007.1 hypothetical protein [Leptospira bandrabouensis]
MIDLSLVNAYNQVRNRTNWAPLSNEVKTGLLVDAETEIEYHPAFNVPNSEKSSERYIAAVSELAFHKLSIKELPKANIKRIKNSKYEEEFFESKNSSDNTMAWPPIVISMLKPWSIQVSLRIQTIR